MRTAATRNTILLGACPRIHGHAPYGILHALHHPIAAFGRDALGVVAIACASLVSQVAHAWSNPILAPAQEPTAPASDPAEIATPRPAPPIAEPASPPPAPGDLPPAPPPPAPPAPPATTPPDAPASGPPDCGNATDGRPPDPRCGETLDGRPIAGPSPSAAVPRFMLRAPQLAARAIFWPVVHTSAFVERHQVFPWMEAILTTDDRLIGIRPEVQYTTGFLPTGGLRLFDRRLPLPGSELMARFRTAGPSAMLGEVSLSAPAWLGLALHGVWNHRRDRLFAGIGPARLEELEAIGQGQARYGSDALSGELRWSRRFLGWFIPGVHADVQRRVYTASGVNGPSIADLYPGTALVCAQLGLPAGCVHPTLVPGFNRGLRIAHAGGGVAFDGRRHARDGSGFSIALDGAIGYGIAGDPTRLATVRGESVLALGGLDRVLLLRVFAAAVEPLAGTTVPFEELISPAGQGGMRGFPDGRFRDRSGVVGTAEYRWFVAFNLDASLFVDVGTVAGPRFAGLADNRVFPSFGLGLRRYATPEAHYWLAPPADGIQLAYAPDGGVRLLLSLAAF